MFPSAVPDPNPAPVVHQPLILGFDPGRQKCGLAVMGLDRRIHVHEVVAAEGVISRIQFLQQTLPISQMVIGNQTTSQSWKLRLETELRQPLRMITVDERFSTLEARDRYWQMYPPRGLVRLIPKGMRGAPRPLDDIVAVILIERYLEQLVR